MLYKHVVDGVVLGIFDGDKCPVKFPENELVEATQAEFDLAYPKPVNVNLTVEEALELRKLQLG